MWLHDSAILLILSLFCSHVVYILNALFPVTGAISVNKRNLIWFCMLSLWSPSQKCLSKPDM